MCKLEMYERRCGKMFRPHLTVMIVLLLLLSFWHIFAYNRVVFQAELYLRGSGLSGAAECDSAAVQEKLEELHQENAGLRSQIASFRWRPLKDRRNTSVYAFMSEIQSRGKAGPPEPPELFEFPSAKSDGMHLCFRGNDSSNGTNNFYSFERAEALPPGHVLLNGTTLISESQFDYFNPWHAHYNLVQFVYWKLSNGCAKADRLILYHWSELRTSMGSWITQLFAATGLPTEPEAMALGDRPICFERAVVSRLGITSTADAFKREIYAQVRCRVRHFCKLPVTRLSARKPSVKITLLMRSGARGWKDPRAWERVIAEQCAEVEGCAWSSMHVANVTFCEQVKTMMDTDVLVSVHGAQLTNMIFMSPGGRVLEMFPKGWLELAGHGQFIYRQQARWNGLTHGGYWRDNDQPDCPDPEDEKECMVYYKDQSVGINETHISGWLGGVLSDFVTSKPVKAPASSELDEHGDHPECACLDKESHDLKTW